MSRAGSEPGRDRVGVAHGSAPETPVRVFQEERPRLVGIAYRMLGSLADAEDVVQEAWMRWEGHEREVERPAAWLTTVTTRLSIDRLRAQRRRREAYVGPWLPDPVPTDVCAASPSGRGDPDVDADTASGPEDTVLRSESLQMGFLVLLDTLGEVERAVFVLADVFGVPFGQVADVVGRSPDACRQIASRARRRVREGRSSRRPVDEGLLAELVAAVAVGDVSRVVSLVSPEVVYTSDGGPHRRAARRPVVGPERVARLLTTLASRAPDDVAMGIEEFNAAATFVVRSESWTFTLSAETDPATGAVVGLMSVLNPDKLAGLERRTEML